MRDKLIDISFDVCEHPDLDAQCIYNYIIDTLDRYSLDKEYLVKNPITFTSGGASVMLGTKSSSGRRLKKHFPALFICYCMNHRLVLAVSGVIKAIDAFYALETIS